MGVYVKGMKMPKNCHSCPMCLMRFCQVGDRELSEQETRPNAKRPEDCPLVPVPEPHGRLVDADEMYEEFVLEGQRSTRYKLGEVWELNGKEIRRAIYRLPTIIPAEPSEGG